MPGLLGGFLAVILSWVISYDKFTLFVGEYFSVKSDWTSEE